MGKTLHNTNTDDVRKTAPDVVTFGDGNLFKLLAKASSEREGWMKSTKAMEVPGGAVVQVTTQQRNPDGSYAIAEALTFVPGVVVINVIMEDQPEVVTGRYLSKPNPFKGR